MTTVTGKRVILKNLQNEYLIPFTDQGGSGNPDDQTIYLNANDQLVAFGNETKDGQLNYDWYGTFEEYQTAIQAGTIQDNWTCYITDFSTQDTIDIIRRAKANLPYVLLEPKWFEQDPQNASWLAADGTFKDGTVYTDAYDAIATELDDSIAIGEANANGYVKRGLSVKLSTDTYTDYDYVINTSAHTFRLPTKTNIVGGGTAPVIGNGIALGLFDGTHYNGLHYNSNYGLTGGPQQYGADVGHFVSSNNSTFTAGSAIGLTLDASKSGIEAKLDQADNVGLVLCFYIGDIITDLSIINGGAVLHSLENKINLDLSNLPNNSKSEIAGYGMPSSRYIDLTLGASGSTYTAPANGWFALRKIAGSTGKYLQIANGGVVYNNWSQGNVAYVLTCPVYKGDSVIITYDMTGTTEFFRFVYAEGSYFD